MKNIFRISILAVLLPIFSANAQEIFTDALRVERNDRGTVRFARFEANGNVDRKLENDAANGLENLIVNRN